MKSAKASKLILVFIATLLQGACLTGPDDGDTSAPPIDDTTQPTHNEVTVDRSPLRLTLHTDRAEYGSEHPVEITFKVRNPTHDDVTLSFVSGQEHDIQIRDLHGAVVANFAFGKFYTMALHNRVLAAGEEVEFRWTWKQAPNGLFDRVHPGSYNVIARLTDSAGRQSGKLPIEIIAAP